MSDFVSEPMYIWKEFAKPIEFHDMTLWRTEGREREREFDPFNRDTCQPVFSQN